MTAVATPTRIGAAAVQLRVSGASFEDIATTLGLRNARAALTAVTRELEAQAKLDVHNRDRLRQEESMRLEALMASVWAKATDPDCDEHLPAIRTAVTIIDRHARLHGLDAPSEVVVHTPTQTEMDQWVATMVAHTMPQLVEADVIDLDDDDIIEGDVVD
jgi:hypothetical protein